MTSYMQVGTCPRCGCPIYQPTVWHGILPPPSTRGCACFPPSVRTVTTTNTRPLPADLAPADQEDTDAAAALLAERPLDELPDLGPNPKSSRLRPQYVEKDAALREDTDA